MARTYECPKCGHDATAKDVNVAKDIMLCPVCGEVSCFSEVANRIMEAEREDDGMRLLSAPPPKHLKVENDSADMTGRIVMTFRKVSPVAFFLVPFTALWSGVSMAGLYGSQIVRRQFDPAMSLFGLPFLAGTVVLVSVCLFALFGKRVLTIARGKGDYFFGVGPIGFRRRFVFDRQTVVERGCTAYSVGGSRHGGRNPLPELRLTHPGSADKIHVCAGMSEDALDYVEAIIRREIGR